MPTRGFVCLWFRRWIVSLATGHTCLVSTDRWHAFRGGYISAHGGLRTLLCQWDRLLWFATQNWTTAELYCWSRCAVPVNALQLRQVFAGCGECVVRIFHDRTVEHHSGFGLVSYTRTAHFDDKAPLALCGFWLDGSSLAVTPDPNGELLSWAVDRTLKHNQESARTGAGVVNTTPLLQRPTLPINNADTTHAPTASCSQPVSTAAVVRTKPLEYCTVSRQMSQINAYIKGEKPKRRRRTHREPGEKLRRIRRKREVSMIVGLPFLVQPEAQPKRRRDTTQRKGSKALPFLDDPTTDTTPRITRCESLPRLADSGQDGLEGDSQSQPFSCFSDDCTTDNCYGSLDESLMLDTQDQQGWLWEDEAPNSFYDI